jgi:uncharacterized protein (UPF0332 family)
VNSELLMAKAQRALEAATRAAQVGDTETAADRAYYSVYYAAWALLDRSGSLRPKTHRGLIAEFSRLFVKNGPLDAATGAILSRLENLRLVADYTLEPIPLVDVQRGLIEAARFIEIVRGLSNP